MHSLAFRLVRVIFWAALAVYLGGLIALGAVAAPAIFQSLTDSHATVTDPASPLANPRQLGGEVFGAVLTGFSIVELIAGVTLALAVIAESLLLRGAMLRKPWHLLRVGLVLCTLGLLAYDRFIVFPQVLAARDAWRKNIIAVNISATTNAAPGTTLPAADPNLEAEFTTQHKRSESLGHTKAYFLIAILALTALANTHVPAMRPKKLKPLPPKPTTPEPPTK